MPASDRPARSRSPRYMVRALSECQRRRPAPGTNVRIVHAWDRALSGLGIAMRRSMLLPAFLLLLGAAPVDRIEQLRLGYHPAGGARRADDPDAMLAAARVVAASGARAARI